MYIKVHLYLLVIVAYFFYKRRLEIFLLYYLSAFVHETAHIVVSQVLGIDVKEVVFGPFGVNAKYMGVIGLWQELAISMAGPLLSLLLTLFAQESFMKYLNAAILLFNVIPIYPLDGGRIQRVLAIMFFGKEKGMWISSKISSIFLIVFILFSISLTYYEKQGYFIFFALYLLILHKKEESQERILRIINYLQIDE